MVLMSIEFLVSYKHHAFIKLSYSVKYVLIFLIYKNMNLRKLQDFMLGYEVYFSAVEEDDTYRCITVAALYLCEDALHQWSRLNEKLILWPAFKLIL